ncbi:4'-phosphopantetheinyl transferase family protein [Dyella subtropica]|uniref:4'-phosphopantetheinyl transferase family protein n=1 Tax=Dyella subtropica TaxID=2992127 RepID=UPI00224EAE4A|nr:4'-phosphopantetheinyl transferase superfamily protein [Dyella subtropica]
MSELDTTQASCATFEVFAVNAARTALWRDARQACDKALAQGFAFVAILREAGAFADEELLVDEDRQRAKRFRQTRDRDNFVLGRTMVHHLVRPKGVSEPSAFSLGRYGKPFLPGCPTYNLSHSDHWVACAISQSEQIGIDVETFEHLQDYRDLLATITHPVERRNIDQEMAPEKQLALFKRCWTRKEAVLKATGKGLSDDLCAIDVRLTESEPVLSYPASLRLVDLLVDDDRVTISLALDPSVPGVVVMLVL